MIADQPDPRSGRKSHYATVQLLPLLATRSAAPVTRLLVQSLAVTRCRARRDATPASLLDSFILSLLLLEGLIDGTLQEVGAYVTNAVLGI